MNNTFDVIVLGVGGIGSAALYHAARRGAKTLGIDRFAPAHARGSSHGETRIIRQAYFEHADYVPLLRRAYELWHELEQTTGEQLLFPVGLLQVGPAQGQVISGVLGSASKHGLAVELLAPSEIRQRFPSFQIDANLSGAFESAAGYLRVERCVLAYTQAATASGARRIEEEVVDWQREGSGYRVTTTRDAYFSEHLIVTPGPWATRMLPSLGVPLEVRRKHVYWFHDAANAYAATQGYPTFLFELPQGTFYGFPSIDSLGVKAAEHSGGEPISVPDEQPLGPNERDEARVTDFLGHCLPRLTHARLRHSVCYYTMSPDEHFLVDAIPHQPRTAFAAGLSGHGFKFASVLGEILTDLAMDGRTAQPIDFLRLQRFAAL